MSLAAGTDLSCGPEYASLTKAVEQGLVAEAQVDTALARLLRARFRLGMLDPPERLPFPAARPDAPPARTVIDAADHRALAVGAAQKSLVLLKNAGGVLPLRKDLGTIAVIGPNADDVDLLLGNYNGLPTDPVTPLEGIPAVPDPRAREEALEAARQADAVVLLLGLSPRLEGEEMPVDVPGFRGGDRVSLDLPAPQQELLEAVVAAGKPVVLVLLNGSALAITWAADHVPAILEAWYPGQAAGDAIADVLFGDANPAGRLPVTFYRSVAQLPPFDDYAMRGRTYRYFTGEPLFPFGHGLSYAAFAYQDLRVPADVRAGDTVRVSVDVRNTGARAGDDVVQLYVTDEESTVPVPVRTLAGFQRVSLAARERRTVVFAVAPRYLSVVDDRGERVIEPGTFVISVGGKQPGFSGVADAHTTGVVSATFRVRNGSPRP